MVFDFDLDLDFSNDLPTTQLHSKDDCPPVEVVSLSNSEAVIHTIMTIIMVTMWAVGTNEWCIVKRFIA
jgi:hypothetical protein